MVGLKVKDVELRFESSDDQFVHVDVRSVELETTDTILKVGIPSEAVSFQVKQLDISVVIASCNAPLFLVKTVPKAHCPAIWLNEL